MKNTVPVFFSIDDNYAPYLAVALVSAIENCDKSKEYKAIILYKELSYTNKEKLSSLQTNFFHIEFFPIEAELNMIQDKMSNRLRCDYFTLTIYFRLFIPLMFPQYDKGIYVDSDVVIKGDLAKLFDIDIKDCYIGACRDLSVVDVPELAGYMENAVGVNRNRYINSGILLMNLKLLREKQLDKHFLTLLNTYSFDCIAPDQDYINAICADKIYYLPDSWDVMPNPSAPEMKEPDIVHYNLFSKPWCYDNIQYEELFWEYANKSGYLEIIKKHKESYSEEQKAADRKCLELLISRGEAIQHNDITFKKMYEKGVKIRL